jgi:ABC-type multidrug transport system fused ATPase/permease subunit
MQITFENIKIVAMPPTGRCKGRNALKDPKTIIDGVSGTILPGQFLAIIGASGKSFRPPN